MVVCRFYMQGYCKFGDRCKYEHPSTGNAGYAYTAQRQLFGGGGNRQNFGGGGGMYGGGGGGSYGGGRQSFGGAGGGGGGGTQYKWSSNDYKTQQGSRPQTTAQMSGNDVVNSLINEIKEWEKNKMWPFSCIAFEKECPCIPDFQDTSPEELRLAAYDALSTGNIQPYIQQIQELSNEYSKKRQMLQQPSMTLKQKLLSLIDDYRLRKNRSGQSSSNSTSGTFLFSKSSGNTFGASSTPFGQNASNQFGSGNTSGAFGPSSNSSGFTSGFGSNSSSSSGVFGAKNTGTFGSGNQSGLFGSGATGSSGPFGNSGTGAFGSNQASTFGSGSSANSFGMESSVGTTTGTIFSAVSPVPGTASTSIFGNSQTQSQSASPSIFGNTQTPVASGFLSGRAFTSSSSPFGTSQNQTIVAGGQSGGATGPHTSVYTDMNKLSTEELAEFQAPHFTLGKIPTKPPPKELCF